MPRRRRAPQVESELELVSNPQIELTPERCFCALHGEPYRADWPSGAPIAMIRLFEVVLESREIRRRRFAGELVDDDALTAMVAEVLDETPACCRISPATLRSIYVDSGVGVKASCEACGKLELGTPFRTAQGQFGHVCFDCVLFEMVPLN